MRGAFYFLEMVETVLLVFVTVNWNYNDE